MRLWEIVLTAVVCVGVVFGLMKLAIGWIYG